MSAHQYPDDPRRSLKKQADYFFESTSCARPEVARFGHQMVELGPVVVIGGFLRDLCLGGNRHFKSDVDFVVDPNSISEFERLVVKLGGKVNKFGGYGITLKRWKVDVWPLERTWAAVAGHVAVSHLDDLVDVTFFDWDAILYSVTDQKLTTRHQYFDRIRRRIIDINLEPNPNPLGNAVRALRYAYRWDAALGQRLASHVAKQIRDNSWLSLVTSERRSFSKPVLGSIDGDVIKAALSSHQNRNSDCVYLQLWPKQNEISLVGGETPDNRITKKNSQRRFSKEFQRIL
jgi:hypothetical protein